MKSLITLIDVSVIRDSRIKRFEQWLSCVKPDRCLERVYMMASTKEEQIVIERIVSIVLNYFPQAAITTKVFAQHDDRFSFAQWGMWLYEIQNAYLSDSAEVVFISSRTVFQQLSEQLELGFSIQCENLNKSKTEIVKQESSANQETKAGFPDWFKPNYNSEERKIGLECIKTPNPAVVPKLSFIPFSANKRVFSIGQQADLSIGIWDVDKGLYDKSAEFEYRPFPFSQWTIRSLRGFRRGPKVVMVNDRIISSASSAVPICNGDIITIGLFQFIFKTERYEELIRYEKPESLMIATELRLKKQVEKYDISCIPDDIYNEIRVTVKKDGTVSWQFAYLRHYGLFLTYNWDHSLTIKFRQVFKAKRQFDNSIRYLNAIRNEIMHPKSDVPLEKRVALVQFYQKIVTCTS